MLLGCHAAAPAQRSLSATTLDCAPPSFGSLSLEALADAPSVSTAFASVGASASIDLPALPSDARAFVLRARDAEGTDVAAAVLAGALPYETAPVGGDGAFVGVLQPYGASCHLRPDASHASDGAVAVFPSIDAIGVGASRVGVLLAGGTDATGQSRADAAFVDPRTMTLEIVSGGLLRRRHAPAVLALDGGFVVAGGDESAGQIWSDAERLDPTTTPRAFVRAPIALSEPRTSAAGLVLANGDGLLVGGRGTTGALSTLERIDARTFESSSVGLASLPHARLGARVARLLTGELLVVGGSDASGAPVGELTLLDASASTVLAIHPIDATLDLDVIALPSGPALLATHLPGEPTTSLALVHADGSLTPLSAVTSGTQSLRWIDAPDGAPLLYDGGLRRWSPWAWSVAPMSTLGAMPPVLSITAADPVGVLDGALLGVVPSADGGRPTTLRFDVRGPLAVDSGVLGLGDAAHLVPDFPGASTLDRDGLTLAPAARVSLADATFASFALTMTARAEPLPLVELRGPRGVLLATMGGSSCPWPSTAPGTSLTASRASDGSLRWSTSDASGGCGAPIATSTRVSLHLYGGATGGATRGIAVNRGAAE